MNKVVNLDNDDKKPCCRYCIYAVLIEGNDEKCLCKKKGMVTTDYLCKKFSLNIMSKTSRRKHSLGKKYEISEFSLD